MTDWWLISDEDVRLIKEALAAPEHEDNDYNCPHDPSIRGECSACLGGRLRGEALHTLDSGLNTTDVMPSDWQVKEAVGKAMTDRERMDAMWQEEDEFLAEYRRNRQTPPRGRQKKMTIEWTLENEVGLCLLKAIGSKGISLEQAAQVFGVKPNYLKRAILGENKALTIGQFGEWLAALWLRPLLHVEQVPPETEQNETVGKES